MTGRLRGIREKLSSRVRERRATRGDRAARRANAQARHREHKTFDEGRRDPGGPGGG
jgi:hypothetical protein